MRTLAALIGVSMLLVGCVGRTSQSIQREGVPPTARVLMMRAPDMFCVGCSGAIEGAVLNMPGVISAKADIGTKEVKIVYDPTRTAYEAIYNHGVFDVYGREFVSDESLSP